MLDPAVWFWAPLGFALLCAVLTLLARKRAIVAALSGASLFFLGLCVTATAFWAWFFRDGLGPGFVPSSGFTAWSRFWESFWIPFAVTDASSVSVVAIAKRRLASLRPTGPSR